MISTLILKFHEQFGFRCNTSLHKSDMQKEKEREILRHIRF